MINHGIYVTKLNRWTFNVQSENESILNTQIINVNGEIFELKEDFSIKSYHVQDQLENINKGSAEFEKINLISKTFFKKFSLIGLVEFDWNNELIANYGRAHAFYFWLEENGTLGKVKWHGPKSCPEFTGFLIWRNEYKQRFSILKQYLRTLFFTLMYFSSWRIRSDKDNRVLLHGDHSKYLDILVPLKREFELKGFSTKISIDRRSKNPERRDYVNQSLYRFNFKYRNIYRQIRAQEVTLIEGVENLGLASEFSRRLIPGVFRNSSFRIALCLTNANELLSESGVQFFGTTNHVSEIAKVLFLTSRKYGIKSFACKRGMTFVSPDNGMFIGDMLFVKSNHERDIFIKEGIAPSSIYATGLPHFDELLRKKSTHTKALSMDRSSKSLKTLLFLAQPCYQDFTIDNKVQELMDLASCVKDLPIKLVVKTHPNETHLHVYDDVLKGVCNFELSKDNLHDLILSSDAAITKHSTTAYDVILAEKPLIIINYTHQTNPDLNEFVKCSVGAQVNSKSELKETINLLVNNRLSIHNNGGSYFIGPGDLFSTKRIVFTVLESLKHKSAVE